MRLVVKSGLLRFARNDVVRTNIRTRHCEDGVRSNPENNKQFSKKHGLLHRFVVRKNEAKMKICTRHCEDGVRSNPENDKNYAKRRSSIYNDK